MKRLFFVAWLLARAVAAEDGLRTPVPDARPLMLAALEAPDGAARGILTGAAAQTIGARFLTTSPITIDVTTLTRYAQAGCSRLHVVFAQDGVVLAGAALPRRQMVAFGIDYCRDGRAPSARAVR